MEPKTPRRRMANFTADEKALLAQLIAKKPIIESKLTDGKSVAKKKTAWEAITHEFNIHTHVYKRDTLTLKRAWDNMKAFTRKARATERGNLIRTGGGPSSTPQPAHQDAILTMVEEAAPAIIIELKNSMDSDGEALKNIKILNTQEQEMSNEKAVCPIDVLDRVMVDDSTVSAVEAEEYYAISEDKEDELGKHLHRKPSELIRREAVLRIKHLEIKKKMETQILKTKLETAKIKKQAAEIMLTKNKLELEEIKKRLEK